MTTASIAVISCNKKDTIPWFSTWQAGATRAVEEERKPGTGGEPLP